MLRPTAGDYTESFVAARARAFPGRASLLDARSLRASAPVIGDVERLRRALISNKPVTVAAIGASNTVRGGCEAWQEAKCSHAKYTNRSLDDGTPKGWLLQSFEGMKRVWPAAGHKLINRALMATGPSGFQGCLNKFIPLDADVALLGHLLRLAPLTSLPHPKAQSQPHSNNHTARANSCSASRSVAFNAASRDDSTLA